MDVDPPTIIRPNAGPQETFIGCGADVCIYGGGAGGGKTWAALFDQAAWAASVPGFTGVIFRRTYPEIMNPGALWDESLALLPYFGAVPVRSDTRWVFPNGSWIKFSHMQHAQSVFAWQGAQLAACSFEELVHFEEHMFWYMLSRLRSKCGVKPYLRATCNPDPMSWVARLVEPFLDARGFPLDNAAEIVMWLEREGDKLVWADAREKCAHPDRALSFQFIPALVQDNPHLDEAYINNLHALSKIDRARLLLGDWKTLAAAGSFFKRQWVTEYFDAAPECTSIVRYWDRAATEPHSGNLDPDWTAGVKMGRRRDGKGMVLLDVVRMRGTPGAVRRTIVATAEADGKGVVQVFEQEPGSSGVSDVAALLEAVERFPARKHSPTGHKADRLKPFSAAAEGGKVAVVRGPWLEKYFMELESFLDSREKREPTGYHDDQCDGTSGAFNELTENIAPGIRRL